MKTDASLFLPIYINYFSSLIVSLNVEPSLPLSKGKSFLFLFGLFVLIADEIDSRLNRSPSLLLKN